MYWNYIVFIICLIAAVFTVTQEFRRANRQRLGFRIAALVVAIASIGAIAVPISYWGTKPGGNEAVLLTAGFSRDSLSKYKGDSLFTADLAISKENPKARLITLSEFQNFSPAVSGLHILGYGLTESELKQLAGIPLIYHAGRYPVGVSSVSWTEKIKQGQRFRLQGDFNNTSDKQVRLVLKDLGTVTDSLIVAPQANASFALTSQPKGEGKITEQLLAISGADTLEREPLPVEITPVQPLKVLVLSGSPGFENKFLKNWLADNRFGVAIRSAISKNKFSTAFINMEQLPLASLSPSTLDKFDVLIGDLSTLRSLSSAENTALKNQVINNGFGLIVRADTIFKTADWLQGGFSTYKGPPKDTKAMSLTIEGEQNPLKLLNPEQNFINLQDGTQTLASDGQLRTLAALNIAGAGKIVFTTIADTYTWALSGNKDAYSQFWSALISKSAKDGPVAESWRPVAGSFPAMNMPVVLTVNNANLPGRVVIDNAGLSPMQSPQLPFQWQVEWWPAKTGWQAIKQQGLADSVYVYNRDNWAAIQAFEKMTATKKYASAATFNGVTKQIQQKVRIEAPKIYFYLLLLFCCAFLWLEGKMPPKQAR